MSWFAPISDLPNMEDTENSNIHYVFNDPFSERDWDTGYALPLTDVDQIYQGICASAGDRSLVKPPNSQLTTPPWAVRSTSWVSHEDSTMPSVWSSGGLPDSFALPSNLVGTLAPIPGGDAQQYGMPLSATNPLPTPVKLSETSQVNIPPQRTRAQKSGGRKDKPHQCQSCKSTSLCVIVHSSRSLQHRGPR